MPELPDVVIYVECLRARIVNRKLKRAELFSPFLLRSVATPMEDFENRTISDVRRLGKRIVIEFTEEHFLVLHLMIAGRLRWKTAAPKPNKSLLALFHFPSGILALTEAGSKRRASLHLEIGHEALAIHERGDLEVLECSAAEFHETVTATNHTLKRTLTDPRILSGIGNAYSDEILYAACLSPLKLSQSMSHCELDRLHRATVETLQLWIHRFREQIGEGFPDKVTAFREGMAVHGRFGQPCPACGTSVQRIVYASNETNYCPRCQTNDKILADRSLSRLLKNDWPRTVEELENPPH